MAKFRLVYALLFVSPVMALTISWSTAKACGTYVDYGSIYVFVESRDELTEDERRRCKLGAVGAMLCVSTGYLEQDGAGALVAEVLRDAESSDDPRLRCMGQLLSKHIPASNDALRPPAELKKSDFYPRGWQLFDTICSGADLYDHPPFGVRLFGPGQIAAEDCSNRLGASQE